jgi:hypothetical protein
MRSAYSLWLVPGGTVKMKSKKAASAMINERPKNARRNARAYRPRTTLKSN